MQSHRPSEITNSNIIVLVWKIDIYIANFCETPKATKHNYEITIIHIYTHHYGCCLCFTVQFDLFPFQKFICSTVRPTYLPYKELYGFDGCASFVADYLNYESLMVPNELVCASIKDLHKL